MESKHLSEIKGHALVLGGSGGIGSEIVRALAANGAKAISFTYGKNKKEADALTAKLKRLGVASYHASVDLLDAAAFEQFLKRAVKEVGAEITIAVNAAASKRSTEA